MPRFGLPNSDPYQEQSLGGIPRINWGHPLTRKLCFSWRTLGGLQLDLVNNVIGTTTGSAVYYGNWGGQTKLNGTNAPIFTEGVSRLVTSSPSDGLGDFTVAVLANPTSSATPSRLLVQSNNNTLFNSPEASFTANSDTNGNATAGVFNITAYDGTNSAGITSSSSQLDGSFHLFSGMRAGGVYSVQRDTVNVSGTPSNTGTFDVRNPYIGVGTYGVSGEGAQPASDATFVAADMWNRALSAIELAQYYSNINQFLIWPLAQMTYFMSMAMLPVPWGYNQQEEPILVKRFKAIGGSPN